MDRTFMEKAHAPIIHSVARQRDDSPAKMSFFGFQTQSPLPRWLAPKSVCQWFPHREQPL